MAADYPDYTIPVVHVGTITVEGSVSILGTVEVKGAVTVSGTVSISGTVEVTGAVTVSGTVSISGTVTISGDVNVTNATIDVSGSTVSISGTVTVTGSVTVSGTVSISGTVTVTGSVSVSGTVSISGSVTVTGSVTVSGAVTVGTVAADNIVIDKLMQTAYLDTRRTMSNDGAEYGYVSSTGTTRRGKWFPRGCRGFIESIEVECKDGEAAGGTITVYIAPYIGAGYLYSAEITVPAGGGLEWRSAIFRKMWKYDSMLIFVLSSTSDMVFSYDYNAPYDRMRSTDSGLTWRSYDGRNYFRVTMKGQTVGDLPVSGTLNTIRIPNQIGTLTQAHPTDVDGGTTEDILATVYGCGELTMFQCTFEEVLGAVSEVFQVLGIVIDGVTFEITMSQLSLSVKDQVNTVSPISMGQCDDVNHIYQFSFNKSIPFRQALRIYAKNNAAAGNKFSVHGVLAYELLA